jgi:trk system potassium uptake protein TrkH
MFIGASPGSTGGGIKTSTFAIMLATISAHLHSQRQVQIFKRGIPDLVISKAISITFYVMVTLIIFCFILLLTEQQITTEVHRHTVFIELVFEAVSAIGTVGLSLGITPDLSVAGKILITFLMFIGRIGATTLMLAIIGSKKTKIRFAEDNVWVG